jgi:hypothetical protein
MLSQLKTGRLPLPDNASWNSNDLMQDDPLKAAACEAPKTKHVDAGCTLARAVGIFFLFFFRHKGLFLEYNC